MTASCWVHLDVEEILNGTDKALLCRLTDRHDGEELWVPLSQLADPDEYDVGDTDCVISVTEWFARQKGLVE